MTENAIVSLPNSPVRTYLLDQISKYFSNLEDIDSQLNRFLKIDQPLYDLWIKKHFGTLLNNQQELQSRRDELLSLRDQVEAERFVTGLSFPVCYEIVMQRNEGLRSSDPEVRALYEEEVLEFQRAFEEKRESYLGSEPRDGARDLFESAGLYDEEMRRPFFARELRRKDFIQDRCKTVYRTLARLLHPDMGMAADQEWAIQLWAQVQAAYHDGREFVLTSALAVARVMLGMQDQVTAKELFEAQRYLESVYGARRKRVKQFRKTPAWNFSEKDHKGLLKRTSRKIKTSLNHLLREVEDLESLIESWQS